MQSIGGKSVQRNHHLIRSDSAKKTFLLYWSLLVFKMMISLFLYIICFYEYVTANRVLL